jgi:hypothetical protein
MKKIIIIVINLIFISNCIQHDIEEKYGLGKEIVDRETYENALPYINEDNVEVIKYPFNSNKKIICKLQKGQKVDLSRKTIEMDTVGNEDWPWYWISPRNGKYINYYGWIYGKYLSFVDDYDESFWKLQFFSRIRYNRSIYAETFIQNKYGDNYPKEGYDIDLLKDSTLIKIGKASLWYMYESGFTRVNTYETDFGELVAFVNETEKSWHLIQLKIIKDVGNGLIKIGMKIKDLIEKCGDDYVIENNILRYDFDPTFKNDSYKIVIKFNNNKIEEIYIIRVYS